MRNIKIHIFTPSGFRWEFPQMKTKSLALWSKTNKIKCTDYIKEGQAGWIKWLLQHKAQTDCKCVTAACVCCVTVEREQWAAAGDDDYMLCRLGIVIQCILIHSTHSSLLHLEYWLQTHTHQLRLQNSSNPFGVPWIFTNKGYIHPWASQLRLIIISNLETIIFPAPLQ